MGSERVTRRLAAIVAADVAGYSRLIAADEEGTYMALRRHRADLIEPMVTEFGGRIANTAGDSLLIEFPSVVDALRCSIDIQAGMCERNKEVPPIQRIDYRIGVNLGDVIEADGDLLGDGVNVAARLENLAEPGGICLSRAARDQVRDRLDISLEDMGEVEVKNISRPVRAFRVRLSKMDPDAFTYHQPSRRVPTKAILVGLLCLIVTAAPVAIWFEDIWRRNPGGTRVANTEGMRTDLRPALIVLPFNNLSGDTKQDYFSDGFTEDITTGLARIPGFLVVARNTAFTFKDKPVDARTLGRELGVRYMLEGSTRQHKGKLRVNAQLIETANGNHIWAERFDRPMKDLFIVQDALVSRIIGSVAAHLRRHEGQRAIAASPETLVAYDLTSRARLLFRQNTIDAMTEARKLLRRATTIDTGYAPAYSVLAQVEQFFFTSRVSGEYAQPDTAKRVIDAAARAVRLAPEDAFVHAVYGMSLRMKSDYDGAARQARRARELAPNDPDVLATVSVILLSVGDYQASVDTVQFARLLDPNLSPLFTGGILSQGLFALGKYEASKAAALDCLRRTPRDVRCLESLVRALGMLGPREEAADAVKDLLRLSPNYTVSEYIRRADRNRRDKDAIARWAEGLRKAGLPK